MFGMAYMAYLTAELFHWSGIISLIGCGLIQAHYAFKNISKNSYTTIKYFISMLRYDVGISLKVLITKS